MTDPKRPDDASAKLELPAALVEDLRKLDASTVEVPADLEARLLAEARERLAELGSVTSSSERAAEIVCGVGFRRRLSIAAAALIGISMWLWWLAPERDPADIDGSGSVDILDALALARRVEVGDGTDDRWDFNRDGRVDRSDADELAYLTVSLEPTDGARR